MLCSARPAAFQELAIKLREGQTLTVVFLNDNGFIGGAGIALRRQAQSFLLGGHDVGVVCFRHNEAEGSLDPAGRKPLGQWLGVHCLGSLGIPGNSGIAPESKRTSSPLVTAATVASIWTLDPDLVICGNFHGASLPLELMPALAALGLPVIAYLHDCHWITGRCAYPGSCNRFLVGCDSSCPTPAEYPSLRPELIAAAWALRRRIFTGPNSIPLATNSLWMKELADRGFAGQARVDVLPLGLDDRLFSPFDKRVARRLLGLPESGFYIIFGAFDLFEKRKGADLIREVVQHYANEESVHFIAFGHNSETFNWARGFGNIVDERLMPVLFNAADVMLSASTDEAFGQTLMEAAACGVPIIAFESGGMTEIARRGVNALTLPLTASVLDFIEAIERLRSSPDTCIRLAEAGRRLVTAKFNLEAQYQNWAHYLLRLSTVSARNATSVEASPAEYAPLTSG